MRSPHRSCIVGRPGIQLPASVFPSSSRGNKDSEGGSVGENPGLFVLQLPSCSPIPGLPLLGTGLVLQRVRPPWAAASLWTARVHPFQGHQSRCSAFLSLFSGESVGGPPLVVQVLSPRHGGPEQLDSSQLEGLTAWPPHPAGAARLTVQAVFCSRWRKWLP